MPDDRDRPCDKRDGSRRGCADRATPIRRTALQNLFDTDEPLDAKTVLAHAVALPGVELLRNRILRWA